MYNVEAYEEVSDPSYWQYYVILFAITLVVLCLLMNTIANVLQRISSDLRTLTTPQIWITVIPFFGNIWIFHVVNQTAQMLKEEYARRKITEFETSPGLGVGLLLSFVLLTAELTLMMDETAFTVLLYLLAILLLILYWIKLIRFREKLDRDSLATHPQQHQTPFPQSFEQPQNYYPPNEFPPANDFPPPDSPPSNDAWDRWKPK